VTSFTLTTYRSCSWREKRVVFREFWSGRGGGDARLIRAAVEYGRVAVPLVASIAIELMASTVVAATRHSRFTAAFFVGADLSVAATLCGRRQQRGALRRLSGARSPQKNV
jgi:hypothetical protein